MRFYDDMADAIGLPRCATREAWLIMGRELITNAPTRFVEAGEFFYGLESTFVPLCVTEEEPLDPTTDNHEADTEADDGEHADPTGDVADMRDSPNYRRPALTWATPKPVDRFEGYEVHHSALSQPAEPVHPLQRMNDPSDPLHGSAWLRKG